MSAEKIIEQIKKDSEKEIKQIIGEAEKQAKNIIQTAKNEAKVEAEKMLETGKQRSENLGRVLISKANNDAKREFMNAKEKIIDECFTKAHHELSILKGERYERLVRKLIKEGQEKLGNDCTVLVARDVDKKIATDFGIKIMGTIDSCGGVILRSADGKVTLDQTFDSILQREKDKIRIIVGKLLFS